MLTATLSSKSAESDLMTGDSSLLPFGSDEVTSTSVAASPRDSGQSQHPSQVWHEFINVVRAARTLIQLKIQSEVKSNTSTSVVRTYRELVDVDKLEEITRCIMKTELRWVEEAHDSSFPPGFNGTTGTPRLSRRDEILEPPLSPDELAKEIAIEYLGKYNYFLDSPLSPKEIKRQVKLEFGDSESPEMYKIPFAESSGEASETADVKGNGETTVSAPKEDGDDDLGRWCGEKKKAILRRNPCQRLPTPESEEWPSDASTGCT